VEDVETGTNVLSIYRSLEKKIEEIFLKTTRKAKEEGKQSSKDVSPWTTVLGRRKKKNKGDNLQIEERPKIDRKNEEVKKKKNWTSQGRNAGQIVCFSSAL